MERMKASKYVIEVAHTEGSGVLYHLRTNELLRVSEQAYASLKGLSETEQTTLDPYVRGFFRRGFCVPAEMDESARFFEQYLRFSEIGSEELSFTIAATTLCNYRCPYCFEEGARADTLTEHSCDAICDFMERMASQTEGIRSIHIKWFGGEPLLAYDGMLRISERILNFCTRHNLSLYTRIITNGSLLTDEMVSALLPFGLKSIQITMDGTCDDYCRNKGTTKENYETVLSLLDRLCEKVRFNIRLNVVSDNLSSLKDLATELYRNERIRNHVTLYPAQVESHAVPVLSATEYRTAHADFLQHLLSLGWHFQIKNALPERLNNACYGLDPQGYILDPLGNLYDCEMHIGTPSLRFATILEDRASLLAKKQAARKAFERSLSAKCLACAYFPLCFSGCPYKRREDEACLAFQGQVLDTLKLVAQISG